MCVAFCDNDEYAYKTENSIEIITMFRMFPYWKDDCVGGTVNKHYKFQISPVSVYNLCFIFV